MPTFMGALQGKDDEGRRWLRIMLRARERQPAERKRALIETVTRVAREAFPGNKANEPRAEVTGFFVLLTRLIESMIRDQWVTFGIATGAIFLMLLVGFRRLSWALVGLIPNALPVFALMGALGWLGLKINMGTAMIAAVSMGMSVDSSIHYFAAFGRLRRSGQAVHEALDAVQRSVGRAMVVSTLALIVGFSVLCTSEFVPTIYFGALVSLAMLGGMAGNLVVLPLLLSVTEKDRP
jgi:predicted RND superfamily exporter protein